MGTAVCSVHELYTTLCTKALGSAYSEFACSHSRLCLKNIMTSSVYIRTATSGTLGVFWEFEVRGSVVCLMVMLIPILSILNSQRTPHIVRSFGWLSCSGNLCFTAHHCISCPSLQTPPRSFVLIPWIMPYFGHQHQIQATHPWRPTPSYTHA